MIDLWLLSCDRASFSNRSFLFDVSVGPRWTRHGMGGSLKIHFLKFANVWSALYERILPCSDMWCPLPQTNKKLAKSNQERKPYTFGVNMTRLFCTSGFESKDIGIQKKLLFLTNGWSCVRHVLSVDLWEPPLICGAHYWWTSFICFNVHISLHTRSKVEDLIWSSVPLRLRCWCFLGRFFASAP